MLSPVSITVICVQLFPGFDWAYRLHQSLDTEAQQQRDAINTSQLRETDGFQPRLCCLGSAAVGRKEWKKQVGK